MTMLGFLFFVIFAVGVAQSATTISYSGPCPSLNAPTCPDTTFMDLTLYTLGTAATGQRLDVAALNNMTGRTKFNKAKPTKFIIHGFQSSAKDFVGLRTEYFKKGDYNIIMVDWSILSVGPLPCYPFAQMNLRHVGECVGQLIQRLRAKGVTDIHAIGHSLGAQTINYVAKFVNPKLPRVTGLDPAGPFFDGTDSELDATDGVFVDVIHTNANVLGKRDPVGHVDFYFNGGTNQPGCFVDVICSHGRAVEFFSESINSNQGFYGKPCPGVAELWMGSCNTDSPRSVLMGDKVLTSTRGMYHVPTGDKSPFALGK